MAIRAGQLVIDVSAGTSQFILDLEKANVKLKDFGGSAQSAGNPLLNLFRIGGSGFDSLGSNAERAGTRIVSSMQASSAALRTLEGGMTGSLRVAERFLSTFSGLQPVLQGIYPLLGAFSLVSIGVEGVERIGKMAGFFGETAEKEKKAAEEAKELDEQIKRIGEDIAKIDLQKFELQFGPAAAKAREAAQSVNSINMSASRTTIAMLQARAAQQEAEIGGSGAVKYTPEQLDSRTDISAGMKAKIKALEDTRREIGKVQDELIKDQKQSDLLSLQSLKQSGDDYTAAQNDRATAADKAAEAQKKAWDKLKQADEAGLAADAETYKSSLGEQISYWQSRLDADLKGTDQEGAIYEKINQLRNLQGEAVARVAQRGSQDAIESARKAQEAAHKLDELIARAEELNAKIGVGGTDYDRSGSRARISEVQAKGSGDTQDIQIQGQKLTLERSYGQEIGHTLQQQVTFMAAVAALDERSRQAKIEGLVAAQQIAQHAADEANAKGDIAKADEDSLKAAELGAQIDQERAKSANDLYASKTAIAKTIQGQNLGFQIGQDLDNAIHQQLPQALGGAFANIIFGGNKHESAGRQLGDAAKGVGKSLVGQVATQAIERLIATIIPQIAIGTAQVTALTANTAADIALTAAVVALTAATTTDAVTNLIPFAAGGEPPTDRPSVVGEKGPEIFWPKSSGTIIPNHKIGPYLGGGATMQAGTIIPKSASFGSSAFANITGPTSDGGSSYSSSFGQMHFHAHGVTDPSDFIDYVAKKLPIRLKSTSPVFGPASI